jgi:hypothetical protein
MGATEFKDWRDRLGFAKEIWKKKGLLGTQYASAGGRGTDQVSNMRLMIDFYRGWQWGRFDFTDLGIQSSFVNSANKVFPIANGIEGDLTARSPRIKLRPRTIDSVRMAPAVESLYNYDIVEQNMKRQLKRAFRHHLFAPFGAIRHGFTPSEEFEAAKTGRRMQLYRPAIPDRPWIRAIPIWDVLMDPRHTGFHVDDGGWWVAFRTVDHIDDIRDNPNMVNRDGLKDFAGNISPEWHEMMPDYMRNVSDPDKKNFVEVWTVYESKERTWHQMTLDGIDKPLRERADWPIDWETLPVNIFAVNEQMDTPFPLSMLDQLGSTQEEINLLRTMMSQLVFRLRRLIGVDKNGLVNDSDLEKIQHGAMHEILGVFPQELLQYLAVLEEDMREKVGQSKPGRGQRINVESATEAANVQQGQDAHLGRINDCYEDFVTEVIRTYAQGRRETMAAGDRAELVPIVGQIDADGLQQWLEVRPEDLHAEYEFTLIADSMRKGDKMREVALAQQALAQAIAASDLLKTAFFARKWVEALDYDPVEALTSDALTASAVRQLDQMRRNAQIGEEKAAGGGVGPEVALATSNAQAGRGTVQ